MSRHQSDRAARWCPWCGRFALLISGRGVSCRVCRTAATLETYADVLPLGPRKAEAEAILADLAEAKDVQA